MTALFKNFTYLIFLAIILEGCFVVGVGNSVFWDNKKDVRSTSSSQDTIKVEASIQRDNIIIPFPFFLFVFDRKDYSLTLNIETKSKLFQKIDSATYIISDLKDNVISRGTCEKTSNEFSQMAADTIVWNYYYSWAQTGYVINIPKIKRKEDIKINCKLFLQDINQNDIIKEQTIKLASYKSGYWIEPIKW